MKLTLAIRAFEAGAVTDHYEDGSCELFDSITAEIRDGPRTGERLQILVETDSALAEQWNRPGQTLVVAVDEGDLDSQQVFAGAFTIEGGA